MNGKMNVVVRRPELAACGLLDLPPHKATRAAGYITTREGLLVLKLFEKRLAG